MPEPITGSCHCGNISFELHTETPLEDITARACDCSFCRIHGTRTWFDSKGEAVVTVKDQELLQRYTFNTKTTDFLICKTCGAYAGAIVSEGEESWSTLNLRLTGVELPEKSVHYGPEDRTTRRTRRRLLWTPTRLEFPE